MTPKYYNQNTIKNIDHVDVDLKFEQYIDRTWVYEDKFPEFQNDYDESQENSSLNKSSRVQFSVKTTYRDPHDPDEKEITKSVFIPETTVYGGTNGVKLFLKNKVMESIYRWEDSSKEILSMEMQNMYINDKSVIKDYSFRNIKMYGTIIILDTWQMLVILMVVVFHSSYLIHYITQMKRTREKE